ncbi:MAG: glycosyltransferase [Microbacterium sp.]|jgi:dolichol-phosphate mannosyltransferase|uniref:glycosyltransferase n=1 Tax=Microbacterium sp. TaxID=51671 RepID=UPI00282BB7BA|nr:glycosyltransferase [Microbacterium sp.]MDR2323709.1 glycosyltransferase [Microbacterium sp.]
MTASPHEQTARPLLSIVVPTYDEAANVHELIRRTDAALSGLEAELLFVDDGTDDLPAIAAASGAGAALIVRTIRREVPSGGLSGAVVEGIRQARAHTCVVMDGDLQHPPELIRSLWDRRAGGDVDVVVASRYAQGGDATGLAGRGRTLVSGLSTMLARALFPTRLQGVTDPMTGFFLLDTTGLDLEELRPRGFKILLEILVRRQWRVAEVPLVFAGRFAGESKASARQGLHFLSQLWGLRVGTMLPFRTEARGRPTAVVAAQTEPSRA